MKWKILIPINIYLLNRTGLYLGLRYLEKSQKNMMNEKDKPHIHHMSLLEKSQFRKAGTLKNTQIQGEKTNTHDLIERQE